MMRVRRHSSAAAKTTTHDADGKIKVTPRRNSILGLFQKKEKDGNKVYKRESLKGRNPVDFGEAQRLKEKEENVPKQQKQKPKANTASRRPAPPQRRATAPPETFPFRNRHKTGVLDGRNPIDFEKCDPYGNPIKTKRRSDSSLAGRNPVDFNGVPCDPYGNPLAGRNPVDFDQVNVEADDDTLTCASTSRESVGDGNEACLTCPHCKRRLAKEAEDLAKRQAQAEERLRLAKEKMNRLALEAARKEHLRQEEAERKRKLQEEAARRERILREEAARKRKLADEEAAARRKQEEEDERVRRKEADRQRKLQEEAERCAKCAQAEEAKRIAIHQAELDRLAAEKAFEEAERERVRLEMVERERLQQERIQLAHAETLKREIKKDVPEWTQFKLNQTKRGSVIRNIPGEREKFSLPTYHTPRQPDIF